VNYYPSDPRSDKNSKLKRRETVVREAIDDMFEGFIHDKAFSTGGCCPHSREIDHRITINRTVFAVETDEKAHVSYNKVDEINRYDDLFVAYSAKFVFIRFNCDTTREQLGAKTSLDHKIQVLLECIGTQIARIRNNENTELCEIVKLFYCKSCSKNGSDICLCPPPGPRRGCGRASIRISCDVDKRRYHTTHTQKCLIFIKNDNCFDYLFYVLKHCSEASFDPAIIPRLAQNLSSMSFLPSKLNYQSL